MEHDLKEGDWRSIGGMKVEMGTREDRKVQAEIGLGHKETKGQER